MTTGVYRIYNVINGKNYIGSSKNCNRRATDHFKLLKAGKHPNSRLQNLYNHYGKTVLKFEIIEECSIDKLSEREVYWSSKLESYGRKGYNIKKTGTRASKAIDSESYRRRGDTCKIRIKVFKYNLEGELIAEYDSLTLAGKSVGTSSNLISGCLISGRHYTKGYLWFTDKDEISKFTRKGKHYDKQFKV